jgi:site-specific recombinase XerD
LEFPWWMLRYQHAEAIRGKLALLYVGGFRRTELASLRLSDYDPQTRTLRIRGKGNKERAVYAEGGADLLLAGSLELRGEGEPGEPLFLPVRKDGEVQHADPYRTVPL